MRQSAATSESCGRRRCCGTLRVEDGRVSVDVARGGIDDDRVELTPSRV